MRAAVVTNFGKAPTFMDFADPAAAVGRDELVVKVLACGLHPRVRSQASGTHYTSTADLPLVPGIDGVGRGADGLLRYFVLPDTTLGAMAERTVIDVRRSVVLPAGADPVAVAAIMNPAMSSWVALRRRIDFSPGQDVLVLGATGSAGRLAVDVARLLGARRVIASGRNAARLSGLAASGVEVVELEDLAGAGDVDVVLDYVWGDPTAAAMAEIVTGRTDRGRPLTWVEIGSVAGPTASIPSAALRAARLSIVGSGQGSVDTADIVAELAALADRIVAGDLHVDTRPVPLSEVERVWAEPAEGARLVLVP